MSTQGCILPTLDNSSKVGTFCLQIAPQHYHPEKRLFKRVILNRIFFLFPFRIITYLEGLFLRYLNRYRTLQFPYMQLSYLKTFSKC